MAKWTLNDYIFALREKIDEVGTTDLFKDEELTRYLNAAIMDMANELQIEELKTAALSEVSSIDFKELFVNDAEKTKPIQERTPDILRLKHVLVDNQIIKYGTIEDKVKGEDVCYIWGQKLYFSKPKSGNLEAFYYRIPRSLANTTDVTDVPELYQHIPLIFAMAECRRKDEEEGMYNNIMQDFVQKKSEMAYEISRKDSDGYSFVEITDYGGGY